MKIAICDNDIEYRQMFNLRLRNYTKNADLTDTTISEYNSGKDFVKEYIQGKFDVIFLDVEIDCMNGIETANKIRELDSNVIIVFLTIHIQYALDGYKCRAFRFINKNEPFIIIQKYLNEIIQEYLSKNKTIQITKNRAKIIIKLDDIKYATIKHRIITLFTTDDKYTYYGKMSELFKSIKPYHFARIHKSIMVNLLHVEKIENSYVKMKDENKFLISRNFKKIVKDEYFNYVANF